MGIAVLEQAHRKAVFVFLMDIGWRHADEAVARVVVGVNQVLDDIYPPHGNAVNQICPYPSFDGLVESLYPGCLLLALTG